MNESMISIVVSSHRETYIEHCVRMLSEQARSDGNAEVIIVADYPIDDWGRRFTDIRWFHYPDLSISAKRNKGIREARGAIIAFIDDDCRPMPEWLRRGRRYMAEHEGEAGVEGLTTIENVEGAPELSRQFRRLERRGYRTNNIFYRKKTLEECGAFDERFTVQREDIDCALTILDRGNTIGFCEEIRVEHRLRTEERWDLLKNCWNRRFDPLLYKKHPRGYRTIIGSPFTPKLGLLLCMEAAAVFLCAWNIRLAPAVAGGFSAVLLVAVLAASRLKPGGVGPFLRSYVSYALGPLVLLAALVHGSVRFKKLLLV